ncbi:TetR/AcrR family transcriptional regulator [Gordonia terrae]|uniref:TetR/AcrR family transcriptional regulator n=1 Tax=Gordonia terrae TaxID=2055 RepID=UPI003F6B7189
MPEAPPSRNAALNDIPERLIEATITLMATKGPSAVKARAVAAEAGMSTMVVYNYFGGIPELVNAVIDHGFNQIEAAFAALPITEDPVADLFTMALTTLRYARANPHLYDAMFGLSTRATYRPTSDRDERRAGHSPAFQAGYKHVTDACARLAAAPQMQGGDPKALAGAAWSFVHGYITLELANHFAEFEDPVRQVLLPMGVRFCISLGAESGPARASHEAALARFLTSSDTQTT